MSNSDGSAATLAARKEVERHIVVGEHRPTQEGITQSPTRAPLYAVRLLVWHSLMCRGVAKIGLCSGVGGVLKEGRAWTQPCLWTAYTLPLLQRLDCPLGSEIVRVIVPEIARHPNRKDCLVYYGTGLSEGPGNGHQQEEQDLP